MRRLWAWIWDRVPPVGIIVALWRDRDRDPDEVAKKGG